MKQYARCLEESLVHSKCSTKNSHYPYQRMVKWQKKTMTMFLPVSPVGIVREQPQEFKKGAFCFYFFQVIFVYSLLFVCARCCRVRHAFSGFGVQAARHSDFSCRGSGPQRTGSVAK